MRFEEFVKKAKEWMQDWLGTDAQVRTKMMRKNNGAAYTGLHDESREVSAVIYLAPIYQKYLENGETEEAFEKAMEEIKERYGKADRGKKIRQLLKGFEDFETVKGRLTFRLISQAKNRELLRDIPHVDFLDLAVVFEVYLGLDGKNALPWQKITEIGRTAPRLSRRGPTRPEGGFGTRCFHGGQGGRSSLSFRFR